MQAACTWSSLRGGAGLREVGAPSVSFDETPPAYRAGMARIPRKKPFTLTIDLLADWSPFADPPSEPHIDHDWRHFGTVTYNGTTGALAWRIGGYGMAVGSEPVREFQLWERIRLNSILEFESPPGFELRPRFRPMEGWGTPG